MSQRKEIEFTKPFQLNGYEFLPGSRAIVFQGVAILLCTRRNLARFVNETDALAFAPAHPDPPKRKRGRPKKSDVARLDSEPDSSADSATDNG